MSLFKTNEELSVELKTLLGLEKRPSRVTICVDRVFVDFTEYNVGEDSDTLPELNNTSLEKLAKMFISELSGLLFVRIDLRVASDYVNARVQKRIMIH